MTVEDGWSKCDVLCGIGYQTRGMCFGKSGMMCRGADVEVRRCLGIDCKNPEHLESKLACSGLSLLFVGIVVGILFVLAAYVFKTFLLPKIKAATGNMLFKISLPKRKTKPKPSKRPPATIPRKDKPKDGEDEEEHLYEEIYEIQSKKPKGSNRYVSMTSKPKKETKQSNKKGKENADDEDSDHGYLEPNEIIQPGSELEIARLRDAPPPPKKKTPNSTNDKGASSHNEYEVPMESDYLEIE